MYQQALALHLLTLNLHSGHTGISLRRQDSSSQQSGPEDTAGLAPPFVAH